MSSSSPGARIFFSAVVAFVLTVLPLPYYVDLFRPKFLVLTVMYWSIAAPWAGGIGLGWFCGLFLDVFQGPVLGEHALVMAAVAYAFVSEHQRIRSKPGFQQALIVMFAMVAYEVLLFLVDEYTGHPVTSVWRWVHVISDGIIWMPATAILGYRERRA
jgi:rod shape-determining protein MreD